MELIFKLGLSAVFLFVAFVSVYTLVWVWTHQIDPGATLSRVFRGATQPDWVATRDEGVLYLLDGQPAATISGPVDVLGDSIFFHLLANAPAFETGLKVEYGRRRLVVRRINGTIGSYSAASDSGTTVLQNVRQGVLCTVLE